MTDSSNNVVEWGREVSKTSYMDEPPYIPTCMNSSCCFDGFAKTRIIDDGYKSLES